MPALDPEKRYLELAEKWLRGNISVEEQQEFSHWYNAGQEKEVHLPEGFAGDDEELKNRIFSKIKKKISNNNKRFNRYQWGYAAAAVVLIMLSNVMYFHSFRQNENTSVLSKPNAPREESITRLPGNNQAQSLKEKDIKAGRGEAILTLGDGKQILLDKADKGLLFIQGMNKIIKTAEGQLSYVYAGKNPAQDEKEMEQAVFHSIQTSKGGKFQVTLPDGTKVWLNANSSLRFPTGFKGSQRQVELKGEAYFEVAYDPSRRFEILARNQRVQVLGTHFNINAYANEPTVNTTLLEGSIKISDLRTKSSHILKPGEQAMLSEKIKIVQIQNAGDAVAWKDGYFKFHEADIPTVMRQIERWYDVSVKYEGLIPDQRFAGEIERSLSLLQVLRILEKANVRFRLEGRELTVLS